MKYNDYPLPDDKVIEMLSEQYKKEQKVCLLSYNEQKEMLNDVYYNIDLCNSYLNILKRYGAKSVEAAIKDTLCNLDELSKLGIVPAVKPQVNKKLNQQTCFFEYLKCEMAVLKTLLYLIFLDNLSFNKQALISIANTRIAIASSGLE